MIFDFIGILPQLHLIANRMTTSNGIPTNPVFQTDIQKAQVAKGKLESDIAKLIWAYECEFGLSVVVDHDRIGNGPNLRHEVTAIVTL